MNYEAISLLSLPCRIGGFTFLSHWSAMLTPDRPKPAFKGVVSWSRIREIKRKQENEASMKALEKGEGSRLIGKSTWRAPEKVTVLSAALKMA